MPKGRMEKVKMAGIFGRRSYEKAGPGISKNAPKKKTFIVFLETFFRNFWKFLSINFVYSIFSLPLVTVGFANAGITNVTRNIARDKHSFGVSDFFDTVKKNWKQALVAGVINILLYALIIFDVYYFYTSSGTFATIGLGISLSILFILTVMQYYIWTLMITFKYNIKQIYTNSFRFVFINFKNNLICFFSLVLIYALYAGILILFSGFLEMVIALELMVYIFTFPSFKFLLVQYCTFGSIKKYIIDPYYEAHPDEDIQKRQDLGIYVPQTYVAKQDGEEENIFTD